MPWKQFAIVNFLNFLFGTKNFLRNRKFPCRLSAGLLRFLAVGRRSASFIAVRRNISQCGEILRKLQFHGRRLCPVPRPNIIIEWFSVRSCVATIVRRLCGDLHLRLRAETEISATVARRFATKMRLRTAQSSHNIHPWI